jgi:hypothetical protein
LSDYVPTRVLPVSTTPPRDLHLVVDEKFSQVKELVQARRRRKISARAALRSLVSLDHAVRDNPNQPTDEELDQLLKSIAGGRSWQEILPGVASVNFTTEGTGLTVKLRLTKTEGMPVRVVREGEEASPIAVKRVDELSYYSLGLYDVAKKVGVGPNRTLAVIRFLKLQDDPACFKEIIISRSRFRRYSPEALDRIREALPGLDMAKVWEQYGGYRRKSNRDHCPERLAGGISTRQ